jgi:NAD(P)H-flavin reductase
MLTHTIRNVGKVTNALCRLEVEDTIGLRGPFGTGWPMDRLKGKNLLIIAGGIGIAPLRPILEILASDPKNFGLPTLLYGARTPKEMLYSSELKMWKEAFDGQVYTTVDFSDSSYSGNVGVVTDLISQAADILDNAIVFICGPEIMMRFTITQLLDRGVCAENIYLSMERNMKCAIGHCGHCQFVGDFVCKDGPVFSFAKVERFFGKREI